MFNALVYLSLEYTTSTNAALINGTTPILTIILAATIGSDGLTGRRLIGAFGSLIGVSWIISQGSLETLLSFSSNRGDLIMMVAALLWAIYIILANRVMRMLSPLATTTITTILALPSWWLLEDMSLLKDPSDRSPRWSSSASSTSAA